MNFSVTFFACFTAIIAVVSCLDLDFIDCKKLSELVKLQNKNDVYFPHEESCEMFYRCAPSGASLNPCGTGTIFSLRHKDCRRPAEAKCVSMDKWLEKHEIYLDDFYKEEDY